MIEIKSLNKKYTETEVLKNINYTFLEGKVYFVVGPSGCGKTTLLNILGGIDLDYEGFVLYDFEDIKEYTKKEKQSFYTNKVSYISQFPVLFQDMLVQNNLDLINYVNKKTTKKIGSFLKSIKLNKEVKKLSVGEKQRVCINRAINQNASVILADEPTASLDKEYKKEVMDELINTCKNKILIVVTHDLDLAKDYADEILEIKKGRIKSIKIKKQENTKSKKNFNKNISLFNARKFASWLYKSEKKKINLYNYSLVIGIVLIAFTNMLSTGMMEYFKNQLLRQESTNFLEYNYEYSKASQEDLNNISSEVGSKYFDIYYGEKDVFTNITIDEVTIDLPSFGLINYEINSIYPRDLISIKLSDEYNDILTKTLRIEVLGLDFLSYVNEFFPSILIRYFNNDLEKEIEFIVGNASIDNDVDFTFISGDEIFKNELIDLFCLEKQLKFNNFIDENFINYIDNQDNYFIKDEEIYRYEKGGLINLALIAKTNQTTYGNVDVDLNRLHLFNKEIESEFFVSTPDVGRNSLKENEIVISKDLGFEIKDKIVLTYNELELEFLVVGLVENEENKLYLTNKNIEYIYDTCNSYKNYKNYPINEVVFLKEDLDYQELIKWDELQNRDYDCSLIEVLKGMLPTMKGIETILNIFTLFSLIISIVTLFVLNVLDYESKVKEYSMLKRSGYKIKDIIKVNAFKYLFTTKFVITCSIFIIEIMKVLMNNVLSRSLGINKLFENYEYLSEVFVYSMISFVISNIIFIVYIILNDKRKNFVI